MVDDSRVKQILELYKDLDAERLSLWEGTHRQIANYLRPARINQGNYTTRGSLVRAKSYDSKPQMAARNFALYLQNELTPRSVLWIFFKTPDDSVLAPFNDHPKVAGYMQRISAQEFQLLANTNFYSVFGEALLDYVTFGTGCVFTGTTRPNRNGISYPTYRAPWIQNYVFTEDVDGEINTVMEPFTLTTSQVVAEYSGEDDKIPDQIKQAFIDGKLNKRWGFIRSVYPRDYFNEDRHDNLNMPFAAVDICQETKEAVRESGYEEFPYAIARWGKDAQDKYGKSPGFSAMADILSLNSEAYDLLSYSARAGRPAYGMPSEETLGHSPNFGPDGLFYTDDPLKIREFSPSSNMQVTFEDMAYRRKSISDYYYENLISLNPKNNLSVEEVLENQRKEETLLGPVVAQVEQSLLKSIILRTVAIMDREGILEQPPEGMEELDSLDVEFVGRLARQQKLQDTQGFDRFMDYIERGSQFEPSLRLLPNFEAEGRIRSLRLGVNPQSIRSKEEFEDVVEAEQQRAALAEQLAAAEQGANIINKGLPPLQNAAQGAENAG